MGLFNSVCQHASCPMCGTKNEFDVQFKYGHTRQHRYTLGDELIWKDDENDIGDPSHGDVRIFSVALCPTCRGLIDVDVFVADNKISRVVFNGECDLKKLGGIYQILATGEYRLRDDPYNPFID